MAVLKEDISNLGQDPCVSVQNSAPALGKVVVVHDLSCGGSEFFVESFLIYPLSPSYSMHNDAINTLLNGSSPWPASCIDHIVRNDRFLVTLHIHFIGRHYFLERIASTSPTYHDIIRHPDTRFRALFLSYFALVGTQV